MAVSRHVISLSCVSPSSPEVSGGPQRPYVGVLPDSPEDFRRRSTDSWNKRRKRLERLVEVIEREGKRLNFPIFSEIRVLYNRLGEEVVAMILDLSRSSLVWTPISHISTQIGWLQEQKDELHNTLKLIEKYPDLLGTLPHFVGLGEVEGPVKALDQKAIIDTINSQDKAIKSAILFQEGFWRLIFTEQFFLRISYEMRDDTKIPNEGLRRAIEEILKRKEEELGFFKAALNVFKEI